MIGPAMDIRTMAAWAAAFFLASSLFSHDVALRLVLLALTAVLAACMAAVRKWRTNVRLLPPIWLPFALWGGWAALTLVWSIDPELTGKEWQNEVLYTALALVACHIAAQAPRSHRAFLMVGAAAALLLCLSAFSSFMPGRPLGPEGWHGGPGNLSGVLLVIVPCAATTGWYAFRTGRAHVGFAAVAVTVAGVLAGYTTLNRTVWIAFTAQALLSGALLLFRPSAKRDSRTVAIAAVAATLVIVTGAAMAALTHEERVETSAAVSLGNDPRIQLWAVAAPLAMDHPLTGYGFGRGMLHEPLLRATGNPMLWHSHNLFIDAAMQTGLPGLLLLLVLHGSIVVAGWRFSRSGNDHTAACGVALVAIVAGMVIRNMTDLVSLRHVALAYWSVVGVLIAWAARDSDLASAKARRA